MKKLESNLVMLPALKSLKDESGTSLVLVLVLMAILGLSAGIAGSSWSSITQRAKEADLLWKGSQIRAAIGSYYSSSHGQGGTRIFPSQFEYLLKDPRSLETKRHLRRPYVDPMTGKDWELIKDPGGRIKGVRSTSAKEPFKQGNFSKVNKDFEGRGSYSEWEFIYTPETKKAKTGTSPQPPTGTSPQTPGGANPPAENSEAPQG